MFCVWNKFTNREGQLYGFFSSLCLFSRGGYMPRKKQNAWSSQQVRDDGCMGGGTFFSALYACFREGGICHARSKTPGSRIKFGMTGELYFSELYVLSGGYLLPLWFYVSFYSPFYLPFCIVDFQVFIVVICLFICNYLPFYSPFTNL